MNNSNNFIYAFGWGDFDKVYIGLTSVGEARWSRHLSNMNAGVANPKVQNMFNKHGKPTFIVLEYCSSATELPSKEILWISEFDSYNSGLNCTEGGDGAGSGTNASRSKFTEEQVLAAFNLLIDPKCYSYEEVCEASGVSVANIANISREKIHVSWLSALSPSGYAKLKDINKLRVLKGYISSGTKTNAENLGIIYPILLGPDKLTQYTITNASQFARDNDIGQSNLNALLNGKTNICKGYTRLNNEDRPMKTIKVYPALISPTGVVFDKIINLAKFARDNGLDLSSLRGLCNNRVQSGKYKGWALAPV